MEGLLIPLPRSNSLEGVKGEHYVLYPTPPTITTNNELQVSPYRVLRHSPKGGLIPAYGTCLLTQVLRYQSTYAGYP